MVVEFYSDGPGCADVVNSDVVPFYPTRHKDHPANTDYWIVLRNSMVGGFF